MNEDSSVGTIEDAEPAGGARLDVSAEELHHLVGRRLDGLALEGRSVVVVLPDATRGFPLGAVLAALYGQLTERGARVTALNGLGTQAPDDAEALARRLGNEPDELYPEMTFVDHRADDEQSLVEVGTLPADRVAELTGGRLHTGARVLVHRLVAESDLVVLVSPVVPHDTVGWLGGTTSIVPGVAGQETIDVTEWAGVLASQGSVGSTDVTAARMLADEAAALVPVPQLAVCCVSEPGTDRLEAVAVGEPRAAWALVAPVAAESLTEHLDHPVLRLLASLPQRHIDLWTVQHVVAAVAPAVADGGELVLYAPHLAEDGELEGVPLGVRAHLAGLRGEGGVHSETGEEGFRVRVTLASQVPQETCERLGLGYLDPTTIDVAEWQADPEVLVVPNAGELLYRVG